MADLRFNSQTNSPSITTEGAYRLANGTRDGALFTAPWYLQMAMEGRVFAVNVGTGTTPTTFNAAFAVAEQDLFVHVPSGTCIIPVYIGVQFEDTGTALALDVMAVASSTGDAAVTGTAKTIYNVRTDAPRSSNCTATAVVTAAGTDTLAGTFYEFWRPYAGFGEDAFNGSTGWINNRIHGAEWTVAQAGVPPIIANGGSLSVTASGQAGIGFIQAMWIEVPSTRIQ